MEIFPLTSLELLFIINWCKLEKNPGRDSGNGNGLFPSCCDASMLNHLSGWMITAVHRSDFVVGYSGLTHA